MLSSGNPIFLEWVSNYLYLIVSIIQRVYNCSMSSGLQNDHKVLMKKIEEGLTKIHGIHGICSGMEIDQPVPSTATSMQTEELSLFTEPFLRINVVSPGSPAAAAVRRIDFSVSFKI